MGVLPTWGHSRNWGYYPVVGLDKGKIETDKNSAVDKAQDLGPKTVDKTSPPPEKAQR